MPQDIGYIVVGNFSTNRSGPLDEVFNRESGISNFSFMVLMATFAQERDLSVIARQDNSLVIRGTVEHLKALRHENGERFSYAMTDKDGFTAFLSAEQDAQEHFAMYQCYAAEGSKPFELGRLDS